MSASIMLQKPVAADRLFLLFHGVGATPQSMVPLGDVLGKSYPRAAVVSVQAPDLSDFGQGFQWFSVQGVTEANRVERIEAAMPIFVETVTSWQKKFGVTAAQTALIGFSQGAIMSLSSTQMVADSLADKIVSLSGRFAVLPKCALNDTAVHFLHGDQDNVIDYRLSQLAHEALLARGTTTTYDLIPNLNHSINESTVTHLLSRL